MNETTKKKVVARIRRVAGQLDGVSRMIEADRTSVDVLLQLASAQAALGQAGKVVLRAFVETRLTGVDAATTPRERKQRIDELTDVFARYAGLGRRDA
jgi:DNA-binding FrmR family transcriptional regulator